MSRREESPEETPAEAMRPEGPTATNSGAATSLPVPAEAIRRLAAPFFAEGAASVLVTFCCQYLYVGVRKPDLCGHCKKPVEAVEASSVEAAAALGVP